MSYIPPPPPSPNDQDPNLPPPPGGFPPPPPPSDSSPYSAPGGFGGGDDFGTPGSESDKQMAALAHASGIIGFVVGFGLAFIIPGANLVAMLLAYGIPIWLIMQNKGGKSPFIVSHALQSLHFGILGIAISIGSVVLTVVSCGLGAIVTVPLTCLFMLAAIVLNIIGIVKALAGEPYRYPVSGTWSFLNSFLL